MFFFLTTIFTIITKEFLSKKKTVEKQKRLCVGPLSCLSLSLYILARRHVEPSFAPLGSFSDESKRHTPSKKSSPSPYCKSRFFFLLFAEILVQLQDESFIERERGWKSTHTPRDDARASLCAQLVEYIIDRQKKKRECEHFIREKRVDISERVAPADARRERKHREEKKPVFSVSLSTLRCRVCVCVCYRSRGWTFYPSVVYIGCRNIKIYLVNL